MKTEIIDRGRGEIAGTRITVYDIWDYDASAIITPMLPRCSVYLPCKFSLR